MKRLRGLCLSLAGLMLMTTPALAADYNFETPAPKDFYGSTSYEEVYGAQYNYGGTNAVDFLDPLADSAPGISINSGSSLEYGINSGSGSIYPDSSGSSYPIQWGDVPTLPATQFTAVSEVERNDGSIGTLVIPSLGIRYKAYVVKPTVTIQTSANLANGYQVVNRADAGGQYMSQWETGRAAWITLIVKLNQPNLPKTGY